MGESCFASCVGGTGKGVFLGYFCHLNSGIKVTVYLYLFF